MTTPSRTPRPRRSIRRPRLAITVTTVFFVVFYLPLVVVVLFSFNSKKSLSTFGGFSLRWYQSLPSNEVLVQSTQASLTMALLSMIGAVVLGTALAIGLVRSRTRLGSWANLVMLLPLATPEIVTGVGSYLFFRGFDIPFSMTTVILAEITFSISYVTVILRARVGSLNPEAEEAAMDLGASRAQAVWFVTLPAIWPGILAAALLIFALVFDDFVLALFTTGVSPQPLSVVIYSQMRTGVSPAINALGTLMLLFSVTLIAVSTFLPRLLGRRGGGFDLITGG